MFVYDHTSVITYILILKCLVFEVDLSEDTHAFIDHPRIYFNSLVVTCPVCHFNHMLEIIATNNNKMSLFINIKHLLNMSDM